MDRPAERFAVAVIRAWIEPGVDDTLRVRVMRRTGGSSTDDTIGVTSDIGEACAIIEGWLREFVGAGGARSDSGDL